MKNEPMRFELPHDDKGGNNIPESISPEVINGFKVALRTVAEGKLDVRQVLSYGRKGIDLENNIDGIFKLGLSSIVDKLQTMEVPQEEDEYGEFEVWVGNRISHTLNQYLFYKDKITDPRTKELVKPLFLLIASVHEFTGTSEPHIYKFYKESEMLSRVDMAFVISRRLKKLNEPASVGTFRNKERDEELKQQLLNDLGECGYSENDIESLLQNPENKIASHLDIYQNIRKTIIKHPYIDEAEKEIVIERIISSVESN